MFGFLGFDGCAGRDGDERIGECPAMYVDIVSANLDCHPAVVFLTWRLHLRQHRRAREQLNLMAWRDVTWARRYGDQYFEQAITSDEDTQHNGKLQASSCCVFKGPVHCFLDRVHRRSWRLLEHPEKSNTQHRSELEGRYMLCYC